MLAHHQHTKYTVLTPVYEGPLDLLLQLIERAELDVTTLALAQVTDQYLIYIHETQIPAEEISSFLVVAAKLLQIKSEALLPRPPIRESGEDDPGESLANQLRIYKRFKEMAAWLESRSEQNLRTHLRIAPTVKIEGRLDLSGITLSELISTAYLIFSKGNDKNALGTVISAPKITIREKITLIASRLHKADRITFNSLLGERPSRLEVVITFLALLELVKRYRVAAIQDALFDDIAIEQLTTTDASEELEIEFE